jgi:hypothetical protein
MPESQRGTRQERQQGDEDLPPAPLLLARRHEVIFHIAQSHTPETCPKDEGGSQVLRDANAGGVKVLASYGAFPEHVIYYIVEAESLDAIHRFLLPGLKRCTCTITPVSEEPIVPK